MRTISEFVAQITDVISIKALDDVLRSSIQKLGFRLFVYICMRIPNRNIQDGLFPLSITNFPDDWVKRYVRKEYHLKDPIIEISRSSRLPFQWRNDKEFAKSLHRDQRIILMEASSFGIDRGFAIPIHGANHEFAFLSVASNKTDPNFDDAILKNGHTLHLMSLHTHALVAGKIIEGQPFSTPKLTSAEKECLLWTARGKTSWEIGMIIRKSEATVNYHLRKAMGKFGTGSKFHAATKAASCGIIDFEA